jgi:hypothetical protein
MAPAVFDQPAPLLLNLPLSLRARPAIAARSCAIAARSCAIAASRCRHPGALHRPLFPLNAVGSFVPNAETPKQFFDPNDGNNSPSR